MHLIVRFPISSPRTPTYLTLFYPRPANNKLELTSMYPNSTLFPLIFFLPYLLPSCTQSLGRLPSVACETLFSSGGMEVSHIRRSCLPTFYTSSKLSSVDWFLESCLTLLPSSRCCKALSQCVAEFNIYFESPGPWSAFGGVHLRHPARQGQTSHYSNLFSFCSSSLWTCFVVDPSQLQVKSAIWVLRRFAKAQGAPWLKMNYRTSPASHWSKKVLIPIWVIQNMILVIIIGLSSPTLSRLSPRPGIFDYMYGSRLHLVSLDEACWQFSRRYTVYPLAVAFASVSIIINIAEIILFTRHNLLPKTFFAFQLVKVVLWLVVFAINVFILLDVDLYIRSIEHVSESALML